MLMPLRDLNKSKIGVAAGAARAGLLSLGRGEKAKKRCWEWNRMVVAGTQLAATWKPPVFERARSTKHRASVPPLPPPALHPTPTPLFVFACCGTANRRVSAVGVGSSCCFNSVVWWSTKNEVPTRKRKKTRLQKGCNSKPCRRDILK